LLQELNDLKKQVAELRELISQAGLKSTTLASSEGEAAVEAESASAEDESAGPAVSPPEPTEAENRVPCSCLLRVVYLLLYLFSHKNSIQ
jgi:hypothetical protein